MKRLFTKLTSTALIVTVTISGVLLAFPRKAHAVLPVIDAANLVQNTLTAVNTTQTAVNTFQAQFQNGVLNTIATTLAKQVIRSITASVVNWINTGFQGSPSFITNPAGFFLDVADQTTGAFLQGPFLRELCSPFSIDIRLALAFKYHPNIQKRYTCTLGAMIKNTTTALENTSINGRSIKGFMDGDFNQGGFPAFVSLTTQPQNNVYGAYLTAESELGLRVASARAQQRDEISAGKGFLSWRSPSCVKEAKANMAAVQAVNNDGGGNDAEANQARVNDINENLNTAILSPQDCPVKTPGSFIADKLNMTTNSPQLELALVDSINEIVNALAAQLVNVALQKGIGALSGSSASDATSYVNQVQAEANGSRDQVDTLRNDFIRGVVVYINNTLSYKTAKDSSLQLLLHASQSYNSAILCFSNLSNASYKNQKIDEINSKKESQITPITTRLIEELKQADTTYNTLSGFRDQANAATTVNDINYPTTKFSQMVQNQQVYTAQNVIEAQQENETFKSTAQGMEQDAYRLNQECQVYGGGTFNQRF